MWELVTFGVRGRGSAAGTAPSGRRPAPMPCAGGVAARDAAVPHFGQYAIDAVSIVWQLPQRIMAVFFFLQGADDPRNGTRAGTVARPNRAM